ncbi:MAG: exonuclease SbcCD subunit D [Anaerolineales bacterium]
MLTILHFADAHIDMANYGRHDVATGLPLRVLDFLKSLDTIVDTAINEKVDLVLFAGDAYKDRNPAPTFQREWGRRVMRLSRAGIPTLLLVGNHDTSPALGRAHTLDPFETLEVPNVLVLDRPTFLGPADLWDLPLQVIALPWISRSGLIASQDLASTEPDQVNQAIEERLTTIIHNYLDAADSNLPIVLTAHGSVQGAVYGGERTVMLGGDLILPGSLVRDPRLDYVALGHIHKSQDLNEHAHPPVIYPGSIERVDFGEAADDKFFIIAHVERGHTDVEWRKLTGIRPFIDRHLRLKSSEDITGQLLKALPSARKLEGAIVRLVLEYPRDWEALIDEAALREYTAGAFEFHLIKHPMLEARARLGEQEGVSSLTPLELLDVYWRSSHVTPAEEASLQKLAQQVMEEPEDLS